MLKYALHLLLAATSILSILLGLVQAGVVLLSLAGCQLRGIGVLGSLLGLGMCVGPSILVSL